jgi:hypothetical protein
MNNLTAANSAASRTHFVRRVRETRKPNWLCQGDGELSDWLKGVLHLFEVK